ncbi:MAG: hypothetical protein H0W70_00475, partial [Actinobacteria bacterium]|nr:hypothetical protein [Actinomycetota bacterium]
VAGRGVVARGATGPEAAASARAFGTFAHVATGDLAVTATRQRVAQSYATVVLRGALSAPLLSDLHSRRAGITLFAYEKGAGLGSADAATFRQSHPEWIAHDVKGNEIRPLNIAGTTLADLTNPAFRAWQAQQIAAEVSLGADGAFIDTLGAYFPVEFYSARPVIAGVPVTDAAWRDASVDLLRRIKTATGKTVVVNGFGLGTGAAYYKASAAADALIAAADGVQVEGFTRWGDAPAAQVRKAPQWDQDLAFLSVLGAKGKLAYAYTKVNASATAAQLTALRDCALGSFLLAYTANRSSFGFDDGKRVPVIASDAAWAANLGSPTAGRARAGATGWSRPFAGGVLTVTVGSAPVVS